MLPILRAVLIVLRDKSREHCFGDSKKDVYNMFGVQSRPAAQIDSRDQNTLSLPRPTGSGAIRRDVANSRMAGHSELLVGTATFPSAKLALSHYMTPLPLLDSGRGAFTTQSSVKQYAALSGGMAP